LTVVPAYGRDYQTQAEALADWDAGKDFLIRTLPTDPDDGRYISNREVTPNLSITIRFNKLADIVNPANREAEEENG
jgi:hypothetical protein